MSTSILPRELPGPSVAPSAPRLQVLTFSRSDVGPNTASRCFTISGIDSSIGFFHICNIYHNFIIRFSVMLDCLHAYFDFLVAKKIRT